MSEQYEVLAIRYGTRESTAAEVFLNYHAYHEPDRPLRMDYFFWVAHHIGGLPAFTSGEVVMTGDEYAFWTGPMGRRGQFAHTTEAAELAHLRELRRSGRLTLTGPTHSVAPGIELVQVGGHTPGQAIVTVATKAGPVVLASDAVHYYEELERDRPFATVANLPDMYAAFDQISELAQTPGTRVVAGHDPLVAERFGSSGPVIQVSAGRTESR